MNQIKDDVSLFPFPFNVSNRRYKFWSCSVISSDFVVCLKVNIYFTFIKQETLGLFEMNCAFKLYKQQLKSLHFKINKKVYIKRHHVE